MHRSDYIINIKKIKMFKRHVKSSLVQGLCAGGFACVSPVIAMAQSSQIITPSDLKLDNGYSTQGLIDIIEKSFDYHPDLLRVRAELDILKEDISLAKSAYRPQLTAQGSLSASDRNSLLQNGNEFSQETSPQELSLQFSQTLYTGGRRALNKNAAKVSYEAAKAEYEARAISVAEEIIDSYVSLIEAEHAFQILSDSVNSLKQLEHVITSRQQAGDSSLTDIAQTTARLATARAQKSATNAQLIQAREELISISGQLVNSTTVPPQAIEPYNVKVEDSIVLARKKNPRIKSRQLTERAARYRLREQKRAWLPTVAIDASARTIRDSSPTIDEDDDLRVGVNFTMPLYQGGQGASNIRRAQAVINSAAFDIDNSLRLANIQITNLHSRLHNSREVLRFQQENMTANQEAYDGIFAAEKAGLVDIRDVLQAQQNTLNAELSHSSALNELYEIRLLLRLYTGKLDLKNVTVGLPDETPVEFTQSNRLIGYIDQIIRD